MSKFKTEDNEKQTLTQAVTEDTTLAATAQEAVLGFEDAEVNDTIIPRIKVINALSPERLDGIAAEGDILNSLTQQSVAGKRFIPIRMFYSNIKWNPDRDDESLRIFCRAADGAHATDNVNACHLCKACGANKFDNTRTGKDAQPTCTAYMNFLGFFEGETLPTVVSFSRTSYNEGRKMLSIAKSLLQSIWCYSYKFTSKQLTKGKQKWYILSAQLDTATSAEERARAAEYFKVFNDASMIKTNDIEDEYSTADTAAGIDEATEAEIM